MWHHISGISFLEHQEQETSATDEPKHIRNLRKSETIQCPKHEQVRTIETTVEQGKVVKNGRGRYRRKQKQFS